MGQYDEIKEDVAEIKADIKDIKKDVNEHIRRTDLAEQSVAHVQQRIESMEDFMKTTMTTQQENFKLMLEANDKAMARLNSQLKIALGVFAALATLVSAYASFFN